MVASSRSAWALTGATRCLFGAFLRQGALGLVGALAKDGAGRKGRDAQREGREPHDDVCMMMLCSISGTA